MARTAEETRAELSEISAGVARLVSEHWGRGPRRTRASWAGPDTLVVLLEDGHTQAEQTLIAQGLADEAARTRALMHEALAPAMTRIVESVTNRVVRAALHATNEAPAIAAEVFVLAERAGPERRPHAVATVPDQPTAATAALTRSPSTSGGAGRESA